MPDEAAVDTTVLRLSNVLLVDGRENATRLKRRLSLLGRICKKEICILISVRLIHEYREQVILGQNEIVNAFIEIITRPDGEHVILNWKAPWSGGEREKARKCRYPEEDDHVLRTAIRGKRTTIYTEEVRMLNADACIYKKFRVHISEP